MDQTDVTRPYAPRSATVAKAVMVVSARHDGVRYAMSATACSEVQSRSADNAGLCCAIRRRRCTFRWPQAPILPSTCCIRARNRFRGIAAGEKRGEERFDEGDWQDDNGTPWLADGQASFLCRVVNRVGSRHP